MSNSIIDIQPLGFPWATSDPFLFCAYHDDKFPGGNEDLSPKGSLLGRNIGSDFSQKDGWSMYHGQHVPGFPAHPHRGFETVSIVPHGLVDHSDSLGGAGRFGNGDVQWLTSGKGVQHAEMFPMLDSEANPMQFLQLWLNLPKKSKSVDPHYKMLWAEDIPRLDLVDSAGKKIHFDLISGYYIDHKALDPTPDSWAADANNHVQIWLLTLEPGAKFDIPALDEDVNRTLYYFEGDGAIVDDQSLSSKSRVLLDPTKETIVENGQNEGQFLFLQGRPINEPVVQHGPFVGNTQEDIQKAFMDYQTTQFGGWPYDSSDPVHAKERGRFAKFTDGSIVEK